MADISDRNILRLDLNLLKALAVLVQEESVTRAAQRLCVTQSAASNMLARLRRLVDDPILVRAGNAMVATGRARQFERIVWAHLEGIAAAFATGTAFDPATTGRSFRLGTPDYLAQTFVPAFARAFANAAPDAQLIVRHANANDADRLLEEGEVDVVVSMVRAVRPQQRTALLLTERFVCIHGPQLAAPRPLTLAAYLAYDHVLVSFSGDANGLVDDALSRVGQARRVCVAVASFAAVPAMLEVNPYLATVPSPFAGYCARRFGLVTARVPLDLDPIPVSMVWNLVTDADPALLWFRAAIASAFEHAADSTPGDNEAGW